MFFPALFVLYSYCYHPNSVGQWVTAFFPGMESVIMKFIGLENYVRMFQDETFREAVVNNLKFVVLGSLFQLCAGLILAILLTHISKGGNILRVIYFIPCIISSMAICQIFSKMLSVQPQGLVCYVMEKLGMEPIALLANSHTALITITLIDGYKILWSVHDHFLFRICIHYQRM